MRHYRRASRDIATGRLSAQDTQLTELVGYRVRGRYGELGTVADGGAAQADDPVLIVRGGVSNALVYRVPAGRIVEVSDRRRTVSIDADVVDFVPSLRADGTVVLDHVAG
jgi:hypothetical protein